MSDERLDALAESARNRGLKLVRSRVRTPTKRRFGKVGLADPVGNPVFGMDAKGPSAKPEDVEDFLRKLGAQDWGASLKAADLPRKHINRKAARPFAAANDPHPRPRAEPRLRPRPASRPEPSRRPKPPPRPEIRNARPGDAAALVRLIGLLDHKVDEKGVRKRVSLLAKEQLAPLVATHGKDVVGLCGIHRMVSVHRDEVVGRITILVVAEDVRGKGIGRLLTEGAEVRLAKLGCSVIEVTSNDRLTRAHAFYRHMGYERTSMRFFKTLG